MGLGQSSYRGTPETVCALHWMMNTSPLAYVPTGKYTLTPCERSIGVVEVRTPGFAAPESCFHVKTAVPLASPQLSRSTVPVRPRAPRSRRGVRGRTGTVDLESWGDATAVCCRIIIKCRRKRQADLDPLRVSEVDLGLSQVMRSE